MQHTNQQQQINKGKLTVLALAMSGALAATAPAHSQAVVTWTSGDLNYISPNNISSSSVTAILQSGSVGTLTNGGTISGSPFGIYAGGTITAITNNNTIHGVTAAIVNDGGVIHTLTNNGNISSTFNMFASTNAVILNHAGNIGVLSNTGTISGSSIAIANESGGTITSLLNSSTGLIKGARGIVNNGGTIHTLTNNGTITASGSTGIVNSAGSISTLSNTGTISGSGIGIRNDTGGTIDSLLNSGTGLIQGNYGILNQANINTLTNNGIISGSSLGISNSGVIHTLTNTGTISGGSASPGVGVSLTGSIDLLDNSGLISGYNAIILVAGSSLGTLLNTGTIAGEIYNYSGTALTIVGGSGTVVGTLTGSGGSVSASDIGYILSATGLTLSGNQLLNDNVFVSTTGTVTNTGVLQVNNPITITGNYVQGSGATLVIGVVNPTTNIDLTDSGYGRLVVSGSATLDSSTITVKSAGYALAQGQRYVVVSAKNGVSDTGVTYTAAGYTVTGTTQADSSDGTYTDLVLTLGSASSSSGSSGSSTSPINNATTGNAVSALSGLFKYGGTDSSLLAVFNPAAALGTAASANKAGAQLSPAAVTSGAFHAADATTQAVNNVATSHMDGLRVAQAGSSGVATGESTRDIELWGQVFGGRASQGLRDNVSGYHSYYRGMLLGADGLVNDAIRAGALVSAGKTSVASDGDNTGSSADVNSYNLTAYASYNGEPWYINALAGVARQQYSTVRAISYTGFSGVADGSFNGLQYTSAVQAGYPLSLNAWLPGSTLTPIAGLSYSNLRQNGYTETGGNGAALVVSSTSANSLKSELGAKLESSFDSAYGKLLPAVQLGWRHEYRDGRVQTNASFAADNTGATDFVTQSASAVRNTGVLNLGVTLLKGKALSLTARYTLESGGGYTAQTGSMQARWQY